MTLLLAIGAFVLGVAIVIVATNRLLEGLVGIARAARVAPFVASAVLSGMEAENVAVGLAAGQRGVSEVALGTAFGGVTFLLCIALGVGALIAPRGRTWRPPDRLLANAPLERSGITRCLRGGDGRSHLDVPTPSVYGE